MPILLKSKQTILFFSILLQACLGGTYSWSVYDAIFINEFEIQPVLASAPFNVFYVIFPLTLLAANKLINRFGARYISMAGSALYGGGWLLASLGNHSFYFTLVGIGLLGD